MGGPRGPGGGDSGDRSRHSFDLCEDVRVAENVELLFLDLDGVAAPLGEQHLVTHGHGHGDEIAGLGAIAIADGDDEALVHLGLGLLGQQDAADRLGLGHHALDEHAVQQGGQLLNHRSHFWGSIVGGDGCVPVLMCV